MTTLIQLFKFSIKTLPKKKFALNNIHSYLLDKFDTQLIDDMRHVGRNTLHNFLLLAICIINSCSSVKTSDEDSDFFAVDHLSDNEKETRLKWKDLMGKETTLDMDEAKYANR